MQQGWLMRRPMSGLRPTMHILGDIIRMSACNAARLSAVMLRGSQRKVPNAIALRQCPRRSHVRCNDEAIASHL